MYCSAAHKQKGYRLDRAELTEGRGGRGFRVGSAVYVRAERRLRSIARRILGNSSWIGGSDADWFAAKTPNKPPNLASVLHSNAESEYETREKLQR